MRFCYLRKIQLHTKHTKGGLHTNKKVNHLLAQLWLLRANLRPFISCLITLATF